MYFLYEDVGKKKDANFSLYSHRYESGNIIKKLNIVDDKLAEKNVLIQRKEERLRDGGPRRQQKAI